MRATATTPPLGWNSWNQFHKRIDQQLIIDSAEAMVRDGLRDAGYEYVVIDGGWRAPERNSRGDMVVADTFPDGIKAVADHVHGLGMKLGLHQAVGFRDCSGGTPGTQSAPGDTMVDKARRDVELFAGWGIDLLKFDLCAFRFPDEADRAARVALVEDAYRAAGQAIDEVERPILYSLSEYGRFESHRWGESAGGQMWRTTGDLRLRWQGPVPLHFHRLGVLDVLDQHERSAPYARPGFWSDPDMLMVGVTHVSAAGEAVLTPAESRAHLGLWAILAAPLMAGHDVRDTSADVLAMLTNPEMLAIDQDPLGVQGRRVRADGAVEVWAKPLSGGQAAILLVNRGAEPIEATATAAEVGLPPGSAYRLTDVWTGAVSRCEGDFTATVAPHDVQFWRATAVA